MTNALQQKQVECLGRRNRDGIAIEKASDELDEVQQSSDRELAIRALDRDAGLLRQIRLAIDRIDRWQLRPLPVLR